MIIDSAKNVPRIGHLRFLSDDPVNDISSQFAGGDGHFIGTVQMGNDPRSSVTSKNCAIHSIGNLYVVSSSLFPTSGEVNPTFTIVVLALRTAEHLSRI